jgi:hypothetical protein
VLTKFADARPASSNDHLAAGVDRDFDVLIAEGFPGGSIA